MLTSRGQRGVNSDELRRAAEVVARIAIRTPVVPAPLLSRASGGRPVWLKLENLQVTGSFKVRGAANRMAVLDEVQRARGVVTCSSGNHGRAVAYVAESFGIPATVCVPEWVDPTKLEAIRGHGATAVVSGATYDEAEARSLEIQAAQGLAFVHPFDDACVIAGQGTIGLELLEQVPDLATVVVPLSGGGLIAGVAAAVKAARPEVEVVGVSAANASVMYQSVQAGAPQVVPEEDTVANALAGGIGAENHHTFDLVRQLVDTHVVVSEEEIREGMRFAALEQHVVVEGGGAVGIAALLQHCLTDRPGPVAVVVSGGNVDGALLREVLAANPG
ncbi:MAG: threonine/serine dehydratase [Gemmatimonadetes bacterium]|nr:threonine/serine dehydratase [Gemmatimonadota bacterium]